MMESNATVQHAKTRIRRSKPFILYFFEAGVCRSPCYTRDTHADLTKEPKVCSTAAIVRDFLENRLDMEK